MGVEDSVAHTRPATSTAQTAKRRASSIATTMSDFIWRFYSVFLSGSVECIVPSHTRNAFDALWSDLKTGAYKDRQLLQYRLAAFKPHSLPGWVALASFSAAVAAGTSALSVLALLALTAATYTIILFGIIAGLAAAFWMLAFSGCFFVASLMLAGLASISGVGYVWLSTAMLGLRFLQRTFSSQDRTRSEKRLENQGKRPEVSQSSGSQATNPRSPALPELQMQSTPQFQAGSDPKQTSMPAISSQISSAQPEADGKPHPYASVNTPNRYNVRDGTYTHW